VPYRLGGGLVEIPAQWMLEDWEQFAFNADPHWGVIPENCEKVYDLWWQEFAAMRDFGCCFVLTMHPWLMGRPSRVRLLERLVGDMRSEEVWFARGAEIASYFHEHPEARRELDLDVTSRVEGRGSVKSRGPKSSIKRRTTESSI
jgi:peptidoglycan-N-acetylglucosamine deacetylase